MFKGSISMFYKFKSLNENQYRQLPIISVEWDNMLAGDALWLFLKTQVTWSLTVGFLLGVAHSLGFETVAVALLVALSVPTVVTLGLIMYKWLQLVCSGNRLKHYDWDVDDLQPDPRYVFNVLVIGMMVGLVAIVYSGIWAFVFSKLGIFAAIGVVTVAAGVISILLVRRRNQQRILIFRALNN